MFTTKMDTMSTGKELREKVKQYIDEADDTTVEMVYAILEARGEGDWWDELPENAQQEIDEAITELDEGKGIPHEEVKKMYAQWFKE